MRKDRYRLQDRKLFSGIFDEFSLRIVNRHSEVGDRALALFGRTDISVADPAYNLIRRCIDHLCGHRVDIDNRMGVGIDDHDAG